MKNILSILIFISIPVFGKNSPIKISIEENIAKIDFRQTKLTESHIEKRFFMVLSIFEKGVLKSNRLLDIGNGFPDVANLKLKGVKINRDTSVQIIAFSVLEKSKLNWYSSVFNEVQNKRLSTTNLRLFLNSKRLVYTIELNYESEPNSLK